MKLKVKRAGRFVAFLLLLLLIGLGALLGSKYFRIDKVTVKGNRTVAEKDVVAQSGIVPGTSIFTLDEGKVIEKVQNNPHLKVIGVERSFPNKVCIHIEERRPIVQVQYRGGFMILDKDSYVIELRSDISEKLPVVTGVEPLSFDCGRVFETEEKKSEAMYAVVARIACWTRSDKLLRADLSNVKDIVLNIAPDFEVLIGTHANLSDKFKFADGIIEDCVGEGKSGGTVDVRDATNNQGFFSSPEPSGKSAKTAQSDGTNGTQSPADTPEYGETATN